MWFFFIGVAVVLMLCTLQVERFAMHDKPDSWTAELIKSHDPTAKELWDLSQAYLTDAWECQSRIQTPSTKRLIMTRDCCVQTATCR